MLLVPMRPPIRFAMKSPALPSAPRHDLRPVTLVTQLCRQRRVPRWRCRWNAFSTICRMWFSSSRTPRAGIWRRIGRSSSVALFPARKRWWAGGRRISTQQRWPSIMSGRIGACSRPANRCSISSNFTSTRTAAAAGASRVSFPCSIGPPGKRAASWGSRATSRNHPAKLRTAATPNWRWATGRWCGRAIAHPPEMRELAAKDIAGTVDGAALLRDWWMRAFFISRRANSP